MSLRPHWITDSGPSAILAASRLPSMGATGRRRTRQALSAKRPRRCTFRLLRDAGRLGQAPAGGPRTRDSGQSPAPAPVGGERPRAAARPGGRVVTVPRCPGLGGKRPAATRRRRPGRPGGLSPVRGSDSSEAGAEGAAARAGPGLTGRLRLRLKLPQGRRGLCLAGSRLACRPGPPCPQWHVMRGVCVLCSVSLHWQMRHFHWQAKLQRRHRRVNRTRRRTRPQTGRARASASRMSLLDCTVRPSAAGTATENYSRSAERL